MAERLRALLEHPLDPRVARAVVVLASAASVGLGVVVALGVRSPGGVSEVPAQGPVRHAMAESPGGGRPALSAPVANGAGQSSVAAREQRRQDPQDRRGSAARRRAARELEAHRALQHIPYRRRGVSIDLVGARGARAILRVRAATAAQARQGWRSFLRRFGDSGRAYLPRFAGGGGGDG